MDYALALAVYIYRLPVSPITHLFFFRLLFLPFSVSLSFADRKNLCGAIYRTHNTRQSDRILLYDTT